MGVGINLTSAISSGSHTDWLYVNFAAMGLKLKSNWSQYSIRTAVILNTATPSTGSFDLINETSCRLVMGAQYTAGQKYLFTQMIIPVDDAD